MAQCSSTVYEYFYEDISTIVPRYRIYRWRKTDNTTQGYISGVVIDSTPPASGSYPRNDGALVDIRENGDKVQAVFIDYSATNGSYLRFQTLMSASGSPQNKLLKSSISGNTVTVKMYSVVRKEVTTLTFDWSVNYDTPPTNYPLTGYEFPTDPALDSPAVVLDPCFNGYSRSVLSIVDSWCDGYTYIQFTHDGSGGITETQTLNAELCGYVTPVTGGYPITEKKRIKYVRGCFISPVYLLWKNTKGGWDSWVFESNQKKSIDTQSLGSYQQNYTFISESTNPKKEIGKSALPKMVLGAENITISEKVGIQGLLYANKVYVLNADGSIQKEIRVIEGSFYSYDTSANTSSIEFEIEEPEINTIKN